MNVYLVPVRPAGSSGDPEFALYCEPEPEPVEAAVTGPDAPPPGLMARAVRSFRQAMAEGEAEERRREAGQPETAEGSRVARFLRRKLAEAVAEHRLLWTLRRHEAAVLWHPASVDRERALTWTVGEFQRDFSTHRFWCLLDGLIVVASAPLALVPGPNFLAYYFIFRSVGHYFSYRGALRGMRRAMWSLQPSDALSALGDALSNAPAERDVRVAAVARELSLERLPSFMRRVAGRRARA